MKGRKPAEIQADRQPFMLGTPPRWLSKDAKTEWRRVAPLLNERKTLTTADLASFENYCIAIGHVRQLEADIQSSGLVIETDKGRRANPSFKLQEGAMNRARLLAAELGLTPVSRSRPAIRDDSDNDPDSSALGL